MPRATSGAPRPKRQQFTKGGLIRETAYLYDDEEHALEIRAEQERCSKAEVIRRALRAYLKIETPAST